MFSLKCVNKFIAFLFDSFPEILQKPSFFQYKTALGAAAETPPGGTLGDSQERLFSPGCPLGRLWDPRAPFGDHLWISLVASSVLEALRGSCWMHLGLLRSSFRTFWHPLGSDFLKKRCDFCFTSGSIIKHLYFYLFYLLEFSFPEILVVTS